MLLRVREPVICPTHGRDEFGSERAITIIVIDAVYLQMPLDAVHRVTKIRVRDVVREVADHE